MKIILVCSSLLLFCLSTVWAQDNDRDNSSSLDTLNTVWQMKYEPLAQNQTHAVTRISPNALETAGSSFLTNGMYGMVPGVLIQNVGFQPGMPPSVRIRGNRGQGSDYSLSTNTNFEWKYQSFANEPIYLLDGMQVDANYLGGLNPDEIESIEIIRNLAGTIAYGKAGTNGVIQIKTKRPQKKGVSLIYKGHWGMQKPTNVARQMKGTEWADYFREAGRNYNPPLYFSSTPSLSEDAYLFSFNQVILESVQMGYDEHGAYHPNRLRSTNWTDLVSQTGSIQEQSLSLLLGAEKFRLTAAGNYFSNTGTVKKTGYDRYSARILIEGDLTRWLSMGAQIWGVHTEHRHKNAMYTEAFRMNPLIVPYNADGTLIGSPFNQVNPLLYLDYYDDKTNSNMLSGRLFASLRPIEGLEVHFAYLPQTVKPKQQINDLRAEYAERLVKNNTSVEDSRKASAREISISYKKKIQSHLLGVALTNYYKKEKINYEYKDKRSNEDYLIIKNWSDTELNYYFGEIFYRWNNQLSVNFLSRIGRDLLNEVDKKSLDFKPAFSVAYSFFDSDERVNRILNQLHLRAGYGKDTKITFGYTVNSSPPFVTSPIFPTPINNVFSEWNFGLDHVWFQNRMKGSIDYYVRKNKASRKSPSYNNDINWFHVFDLKNSGLEISLSGVNIHTGNWKWASAVMLSFEKEKIQYLFVSSQNTAEGWPMYSYRGFRYERLWQDTPQDRDLMEKYNMSLKPGDIKVTDVNKDFIFNSEDALVLGSPSPKWFGSIHNSISYRRVELSFLLYTRQKFMLNTGYYTPFINRNFQKIDYWTPTNTEARYPRPIFDIHHFYEALRYEDASFIRLQNVSLAWSLPQKWISPLFISNLKVYSTVTNPALFTKYSQSDPEGAATVGSLPGNVIWLFGVRLEL